MGSYDGTGTCDLIGYTLYILSHLTEKYDKNIGLYQDDRLLAFNKKLREIKTIKKKKLSINKQLLEISSDKECFNKSKRLYRDELNESGYKYMYSLSYTIKTPHKIP